jgi:hypothetical protein
VLGYKTEGPQRMFRCTAGQTEILGGWIYQYVNKTPPGPMFEILDADASFAGILQFNSRGNIYDVLAESVQDGRRRNITLEDNGGDWAWTLIRVP